MRSEMETLTRTQQVAEKQRSRGAGLQRVCGMRPFNRDRLASQKTALDDRRLSARPLAIVQALLDEATDLFVLDAGQGVAISQKGFVDAVEASKYVGAWGRGRARGLSAIGS